MDQFAKGINLMVPHAVWYDPAHIIFKPDLSPGAPVYGAALPGYNEYIGRLERLLQGGRHVADIALLYPIATLQAGSWFGPGKPYEGCVEIPEADYMKVGELLALSIRRDFTFLHPEVLKERCRVSEHHLRLDNRVNHESYRVLILPGSRCVSVSSLKQIKSFYDQGGAVISTTALPVTSAEPGEDGTVRDLMKDIFGAEILDQAPASTEPILRHTGKSGGRAWFVPGPTAASLRTALDEALPDGDVLFEENSAVTGGNLSYIHKIIDGRHVYLFANSSDQYVEVSVRLRDRLNLELWDPHDGAIRPVPSAMAKAGDAPATRVHLSLPPVHSVFLVAPAD
jgi:alpha-L-rhamnosidase